MKRITARAALLLIAVLLLSNVIAKETRKYIRNLDAWDEESVPVVDD